MGKTLKKLKKKLTLNNIAIFACVVIIIISLVILFEPKFELPKFNFASNSNGKPEILQSKTKANESISEADAKKLAVNQFEKLGEKNLDESKLAVQPIERQGEIYYYICSPQNTLEIKVVGGKITRLNSVEVENI